MNDDLTNFKSQAFSYYRGRSRQWNRRHSRARSLSFLAGVFTTLLLMTFFLLDCHKLEDLDTSGLIAGAIFYSLFFAMFSMCAGWLCQWREESNWREYINLLPRNIN